MAERSLSLVSFELMEELYNATQLTADCKREILSLPFVSVLVMKQPPEIIYTGLRSVIGNPTDYSNNKANNGFSRQVEIRIPTHETEQRKPVRVGANNMIIINENQAAAV